MHITYLNINKLGGFLQNKVNLSFGQYINIVLGANGTGKTTLLKILSSCTSLRMDTIKENFKEQIISRKKFEIDLNFGIGFSNDVSIHVQYSESVSKSSFQKILKEISPSLEAEELAKETSEFNFKIEFKQNSETPFLIFKKEGEEVTASLEGDSKKYQYNGEYFDIYLLLFNYLQDTDIQNNPKHILGLTNFINLWFNYESRIFPDEENTYFRYVSNLFEISQTLSSNKQTNLTTKPLFLQSSFNINIDPDNTPETISLNRSNFPAIKQIEKCLKVKSFSIKLNLSSKKTDDNEKEDSKKVTWTRSNYQVEKNNGDIFSDEGLSFGQKRIIGLFLYLSRKERAFFIDELQNGLHYSVVESILEILKDRKEQVFITTQSPLVIDALPFSSSEEVKNTFILCMPTDKFEWKNFNESEASEFFKTLSRNIKRTNQILRSMKFW